MNDSITDFSPRKSGEITANKALYEQALQSTDKDLYSFQEARKLKNPGSLNWKKTTNSQDFLDPDVIIRNNARKFNEHTNPTKELVRKMRMQETLKYGSTREDLEDELRESLGLELLQLLQSHGVTGSAVSEIFDVFLEMTGENPDVDELIANWNGTDSDTESDDVETEDGTEEESTEDQTMNESHRSRARNITEMVHQLRKRVVEHKIRNGMKLTESEDYYEDEEIPEPTEAQLRSIVRKFPYLIKPECGGMSQGEQRSYRGETFTATKDGTMTPEEVYYSQFNKKRELKSDAMKTYEYGISKGFDLNSRGSYRGSQI